MGIDQKSYIQSRFTAVDSQLPSRLVSRAPDMANPPSRLLPKNDATTRIVGELKHSDPKTICGLTRLNSSHSSSSGSECEPDSICLAEMVNDFLEGLDESHDDKYGNSSASCSYRTYSGECKTENPNAILRGLLEPRDNVERKLCVDVSAIVATYKESFIPFCSSGLVNCPGGCIRRYAMGRLREIGYNAGICKSRWTPNRNSPGGDYEYIDVLVEGINNRILVDLDFSAQFQITRPTVQYLSLSEMLPEVFVGRPNRLLQIVDIMTDAAKASMKTREMHLPPWRKLEYMRSKWLSQYKRTINESSKVDKPCKKPDVIVNQIGNKGTESSPIILEVQALNGDALCYGGKLFCLNDNCSNAGNFPCECLDGKKAKMETNLVFGVENLQWRLPSVNSDAKSRIRSCFKQSELGKQLRALSKAA